MAQTERLQSSPKENTSIPVDVEKEMDLSQKTAEAKADLAEPLVEKSQEDLQSFVDISDTEIQKLKEQAQQISVSEFTQNRRDEAEKLNVDPTIYTAMCTGMCYTLDMVYN